MAHNFSGYSIRWEKQASNWYLPLCLSCATMCHKVNTNLSYVSIFHQWGKICCPMIGNKINVYISMWLYNEHWQHSRPLVVIYGVLVVRGHTCVILRPIHPTKSISYAYIYFSNRLKISMLPQKNKQKTRMWNMISSPATPTVCFEQKSENLQSRNMTLSMPSQSQK